MTPKSRSRFCSDIILPLTGEERISICPRVIGRADDAEIEDYRAGFASLRQSNRAQSFSNFPKMIKCFYHSVHAHFDPNHCLFRAQASRLGRFAHIDYAERRNHSGSRSGRPPLFFARS
ncbi:protein of unknown function [Methylocella tundrae]|uniref:Uncharacterized protein n=1 Tax=Methylocella tundrae TaxID=227605 RepID=A0A4U8Z100_METTU|nr:protein of unknown function [Methylocella tundrae]